MMMKCWQRLWWWWQPWWNRWRRLEQCTMRTLESRNSSGLIAPGYILKNHQKYLKERHFFFKLSTRRKIEKIQFPWVSYSKFSILGWICLCIIYTNLYMIPSNLVGRCLKCLDTSVYYTVLFCIRFHPTFPCTHCAVQYLYLLKLQAPSGNSLGSAGTS